MVKWRLVQGYYCGNVHMHAFSTRIAVNNETTSKETMILCSSIVVLANYQYEASVKSMEGYCGPVWPRI